MKITILLALILVSALITNAQEINLNPSVIGSAGNLTKENNLNISKWIPNEIHSVILKTDELEDKSLSLVNITSYPNPFQDVLNLSFETKEKENYSIVLTDISGRKQFYKLEKTIFPNEAIKLDLAFLSSGFYLLTLLPEDRSIQHVVKVQKQ